MALPPFAIVRPESKDLSRVQDNIYASLLPVWAVPFLDGVKLANQVLGATAKDVAHGLGRAWQGCIVLKRNANAVIYQPSSTANTGQFITLQASATVTADLWVY